MKVLAIIPAYNEEKSIVSTVEKYKKICPDYDYVVVNDGSADNTAKVCKMHNYKLLNLPMNLGLAGAFQTGMKYAYRNDYDCAVQFDADGQHNPEYISAMVDEIQKGKDIVIGSRFVSEKKPFSPRMLGSRVIGMAIKITTGKKIKDPTSVMRMYNRKMIQEFAHSVNYGPEPDTISYLLKNGASVSEIQVSMNERVEGTSYLNFSRSISYMARMTISILLIQLFRKRG